MGITWESIASQSASVLQSNAAIRSHSWPLTPTQGYAGEAGHLCILAIHSWSVLDSSSNTRHTSAISLCPSVALSSFTLEPLARSIYECLTDAHRCLMDAWQNNLYMINYISLSGQRTTFKRSSKEFIRD